MTTRLLPPDEWFKLEGTEAEQVWPHLDPAQARVVVVEREGAIVGCHVLMYVLHAECLWIAPEARGKSSVARRLWAAVKETARGLGAHTVLTTAIDDRVRGLLAHVGAVPLPGEQFCVSVKGDA